MNTNHSLILAIAPSAKGLGFAVLEGRNTLINWGVKAVAGKGKNIQSLTKVEKLILRYQPDVLVLEDASAKGSLRCPRIRRLTQQIVKLAARHKTSVKLSSRDQVRQAFLPDGQGTKHALAKVIVKQFQDQLGSHLPPKRKAWMSEHHQMDIFEAVALVLVLRENHMEYK